MNNKPHKILLVVIANPAIMQSQVVYLQNEPNWTSAAGLEDVQIARLLVAWQFIASRCRRALQQLRLSGTFFLSTREHP